MSNGSYSIAYAWDNAGRLTSTTAGGKTISHQYDGASNRTRTTWPEGSFYVTTAYDALNRPAEIKENGSVSLVKYYYDDLSRRGTVILGNGTVTNYAYSTTQGVLSGLNHDLAGTAQDQTYGYTRNQAQDIIAKSWSNNSYTWTGAVAGSKTYTVNGLNQYTTVGGVPLSYDAKGNLTGDGVWTYAYDPGNRLKSATRSGTTASLAYDGEGRLRQTTINGTATNLLYDGADLVAEYSAANAVLRRYVHGPGVDEPLVWYEGANTANKTWLYADHQGSIIAQANSAGASTATYSYSPFGEANLTTGSRFRYTGQQYLGPLNLYYYKARFYSPTLGRFLQTDPIGYADDANLYTYVGNNPVNFVDPEGLFVTQILGGLFNAAVGAAVSHYTGDAPSWRNAGIDFVVGAISSGTTGLSRFPTIAKFASYTNTVGSKFGSTAFSEVVKGWSDEKAPLEYGLNAAINGTVNASGIVGKGAGYVTKRFGFVVDGFSPNPQIAALLQPKPIPGSPAAAVAAITESLGAVPNFSIQFATALEGSSLASGSCPVK